MAAVAGVAPAYRAAGMGLQEVPSLELWSKRGSEKDWCPEGHELKGQLACDSGYCDKCHREVKQGERIFECKTCDWWMCYEPCYGQAMVDSLLPLGQALASAGTGRSAASEPSRAAEQRGTQAPSEGGGRGQPASLGKAGSVPRADSAAALAPTTMPWAGLVAPAAKAQAPQRAGRWRLGGPPAPRAPPTTTAAGRRVGKGQDGYGWLPAQHAQLAGEAERHDSAVRQRLDEERALLAAEERRWEVAHRALLKSAQKEAPRLPPAPPRPSRDVAAPALAPTVPALAEVAPPASSSGAVPVPAPTVPALAAHLGAAPVLAPTVPALTEVAAAEPMPEQAAPALAPMFPPAEAPEVAPPAAAQARRQDDSAFVTAGGVPAASVGGGGGDGELEEQAEDDPSAVTLSLAPGRHGIIYDPETGLVYRVVEGRQGFDLGVQPGWYVNGIDGRAVDGDSVNAALTARQAGSKPYQVSFRRDAVELSMTLPGLDYGRLSQDRGLTEGLKARVRRAAAEVAAVPLHSAHVLLGPGESGTELIATVLPRGHDALALARRLALPRTIALLAQAIAPLPGVDACATWPLRVVGIEVATGVHVDRPPEMEVPRPGEDEEVLDIDDAAHARYTPVTDFREARCRAFHETRCARGGLCNFMHIKHIPRAVKRRLVREMYDEHPEYKGPASRARSRSPKRRKAETAKKRQSTPERRAMIAEWNKERKAELEGAASQPPPPLMQPPTMQPPGVPPPLMVPPALTR
ncbi:unnamed protein product [Prorocentrum cordatum]|uniref:C3H1-type domain-containing protein n=1 Tax=Prorocentrum cordatum TaxID=2364126 RepID=A0ABN9VQC8_9DINO|nr:unnamed protein product [Polarella glacialis]